MKKMNKKGFTLIELLAVIIILGVLLLVAVPSVSKYIQQSRMKTYNTNLSKFVDAVSTEVNAMDYQSSYTFSSSEYLIVPFECIDIERGSNEKSPFNLYDQDYSFVLVTRAVDNTGFNYYVQALDDSGFGTVLSPAENTTITSPKTDDLVDISGDTIASADIAAVAGEISTTVDGSTTYLTAKKITCAS